MWAVRLPVRGPFRCWDLSWRCSRRVRFSRDTYKYRCPDQSDPAAIKYMSNVSETSRELISHCTVTHDVGLPGSAIALRTHSPVRWLSWIFSTSPWPFSCPCTTWPPVWGWPCNCTGAWSAYRPRSGLSEVSRRTTARTRNRCRRLKSKSHSSCFNVVRIAVVRAQVENDDNFIKILLCTPAPPAAVPRTRLLTVRVLLAKKIWCRSLIY